MATRHNHSGLDHEPPHEQGNANAVDQIEGSVPLQQLSPIRTQSSSSGPGQASGQPVSPLSSNVSLGSANPAVQYSPNGTQAQNGITRRNSAAGDQALDEQEPEAPEDEVYQTYPKWPKEGSTLDKGGFIFSAVVLIDLFSLIVPLCFVVLAILGEVLHGQQVEAKPWGKTLLTVIKVGVTAYPPFFAFIAARAFEMISGWLTARGATIGLLEQLGGCTNLIGVFKTQIMLRILNVIAVGMIFLWALSPVGGQAILRLVTIQNSNTTSQGLIYYLDTSPSANTSAFVSPNYYSYDSITSVYQAALISPNSTQMGPQDLWGNVKIPRLESLPAPKPGGWIEVPQGDTSYSSLVGMSLANVSNHGVSTFVVPTSYYGLSCPEPARLRPSAGEIIWGELVGRGVLRGNKDKTYIGFGNQRFNDEYNLRAINFWSIGTFTGDRDGTFQNDSTIRDATDPLSMYFQFSTYNSPEANGTEQIVTLNCSIYNSNVESKVRCDGRNCKVTSMRASPAKGNSASTPLDNLNAAGTFFDIFAASALPSGRGVITEFNKNSFLLQYLQTGFNPIGTAGGTTAVNLAQMPSSLLAERLSRLMNTLWIPSLALDVVTGNFNPADPRFNSTPGLSNTPANLAIPVQIYVCPHYWFSLLLLSSSALFVLAAWGMWLKYFVTVAPAIVGHISTLTRGNPAMSIPKGGTALDGFERARLLRDVRVRFSDSKPDRAVGCIVLQQIEETTKGPGYGRLTKGRLYE